MPLSDDEYVDTARAALTALIAELDTARQRGDRNECRRRADDIRALVRRITEILGEEGGAPLFRLSEQAMARTIRDLGASAWEEPETVQQAAARMGSLPAAPGPEVRDRVNERGPNYEAYNCQEHGPSGTDYCQKCANSNEERKPLTDGELNAIGDTSRRLHEGRVAAPDIVAFGQAAVVPRLVEEIRRLRSDDWLERAAEEITDSEVRDGYVEEAAVVAILRKHRDGKA